MAMACKEVQELLGKFHDRELRGPQYESVAEHLKGCIHCSQEERRLAGVAALVKMHYENVSASEDFSHLWPRISAGLDARAFEPVPFRRRFAGIIRLPKPVWAAIGAAAAAIVLLFAYIPGTQKPALAANDCIIDKVDAENCSVMVLETEKTKMKIIWVMDERI